MVLVGKETPNNSLNSNLRSINSESVGRKEKTVWRQSVRVITQNLNSHHIERDRAPLRKRKRMAERLQRGAK